MYFRASNIMFAPIASNGMDTETALPTYGTAVKIGSLNRISDNIDRVEASGYGDNARKVHVDEFRSYGLDVEITHIPRATYASLNGASVDTSSKDITFKDNDQAPYGGLVCVRGGRDDDDKDFYVGVYYPKLKSAMQGKDISTKGENITLVTEKLHFAGLACKNHVWCEDSDEFATEAEAVTWCKTKLGVSSD